MDVDLQMSREPSAMKGGINDMHIMTDHFKNTNSDKEHKNLQKSTCDIGNPHLLLDGYHTWTHTHTRTSHIHCYYTLSPTTYTYH